MLNTTEYGNSSNDIEVLERALHKFGEPAVDKYNGPNEAAVITVLLAQLKHCLPDNRFIGSDTHRRITRVAMHINMHNTLPITHMLFSPGGSVNIVLLSSLEIVIDYTAFKTGNGGRSLCDLRAEVRAIDRYRLVAAENGVYLRMNDAYVAVRQLISSNINMALLGGIEFVARDPRTITYHLQGYEFSSPPLDHYPKYTSNVCITEADIDEGSIFPLIVKHQHQSRIVPDRTHFKALPSVEVFDRDALSFDIADVVLYEGTATVRNGASKTLLTGKFIVKYVARPCVFFAGTGVVHSNGALLSGTVSKEGSPDERTLSATGMLNIYQGDTDLCHMQVMSSGVTTAIYKDTRPRLGGTLYRFVYVTETDGVVKTEAEVYAFSHSNKSVTILSKTDVTSSDSVLNNSGCIIPLSELDEWIEQYLKTTTVAPEGDMTVYGYRSRFRRFGDNYTFNATNTRNEQDV